MGPWRFVGRADEFARLTAVATDARGRGLIISGTAGIGKSWLLREVVAALPTDRLAVFTVSAAIATAGLPFGGLAQILPAEPPGRLSPAGLLRWALETLCEQATGRPIVLAVDDAHLLDPSSAALIHLAARSARGTLLGTFRSGERLPAPIRGLWSDGLVDHLELAPLNLAETTALLTEMLGGPVDTHCAERLWRLSAGHPLLLRELVTAARAGNELTLTYGVWQWTGRLRLAPSVLDLVDARVDELSTEVRTVVELVALGEPIGLELLLRASGAAPVEAAEEHGLIRVLDDGRRHNVALAHPLYGEVVRRRCPVTRSRRLRARLADLVEKAGARRRDDPLRIAVWRLDADVPRDPRSLFEAAVQALGRFEVALAARLAQAALDAGAGLAAAELLATVLLLRDEPERALATLEHVGDRPDSPRRRGRWAATRAAVAHWGLCRDGAADELAAETAALTDPASRALPYAVEALIRVCRLDLGAARRLADAVLGEPAAAPAARALAGCVRAWIAATAGEPGRGGRALATAAAECGGRSPTLPHLRLPLELTRGDRLLLAADLPGIEAAAATEFAELAGAGDLRPGSGYLWLLRARGARLRGQTAEASRRSRQACAALSANRALAGLAHAERAHVAAVRGEATEAAAALAEADAAATAAMAVWYPWVEQARCWVAVSAGDHGRGVRLLRELLDRLRADGLTGHEVHALHDLVRLGRPELAVERLTELSETLDGPLVGLVARQARAAAGGAGAELLAVADGFAELGLRLFAAEAAAMGVARLRAARSPRVGAATARLGDVLQSCDAVATPAVCAGQPSLTRRERQIARLAARGVASRDIAEELFISPRTVENHLQRIYTKLGVNGRAGLGPALRALPELDVDQPR